LNDETDNVKPAVQDGQVQPAGGRRKFMGFPLLAVGIFLLLAVAAVGLWAYLPGASAEKLTVNDFDMMLEEGRITKVVQYTDSNELEVTYRGQREDRNFQASKAAQEFKGILSIDDNFLKDADRARIIKERMGEGMIFQMDRRGGLERIIYRARRLVTSARE